MLSFQETNDHDRNENENGAKDPSKDDRRLARAILIPRPNNWGRWNWSSAVWSCNYQLYSSSMFRQPTFVKERAHAAIDRVADVIVRGAVTSLCTVLPKKPLRTLKLASGACKARSTMAPSDHLLAVGAIVTKALVDAVRSKSACGAGLGAVLAHQATRASALAGYVVTVCVVLTPALLAAALPIETGPAGARAFWTCEAGRANATS